jgi:hypothetical protein
LDGEFYGFFPSGNNVPGGDFAARLDAVHNRIFPAQTIVGFATPNVPPGTPAQGGTAKGGQFTAFAILRAEAANNLAAFDAALAQMTVPKKAKKH